MAFSNGPFGGGAPEADSQPAPNAEVAQLAQQLQEMNQKFETQRTLLLQSQTSSAQQLDLLRRQLSETVSRNQGHAPAEPSQAPPTDDWMQFLASNNSPAPAAPAAQQQRPLSADEVRSIFQQEENKKHTKIAQEHQKVEELNARFMVEHPELAKDTNAIALIRNQFLALSNLRPDLAPEARYQFAIDNVVKDVLPNLKFAAPADPKPAKQKAANPYMPNVFAAPPGRGNVQDIMGMVDNTPMEEKFANREKELLNWQKNRNKSFFGG